MPASSGSSINKEVLKNFVQKVVKEIEDEGIVEVVGLGIKDRNVRHIYSQNETIKKADELENAVLNLVKKQIIKH